jgi:hypothetical protein
MKKTLLIGLVVLGALFALWYVGYRRRISGLSDCIRITPGKFGTWSDAKIPHGDLREIAEQYLEGDPQEMGSIAGGFFKAINVYPSTAAAKYYRQDLGAWANSNVSLPYWNVVTGELLCKN